MAHLALITGLSVGWLIAGGLAAGVPIIAHMLSRRGGRRVIFPAVAFLQRAAAEQARRHRLRDLLLLAMRICIVLLIALAFDRPAWSSRAAARPVGSGEDVIIVLDASASMSRIDGGRALYDRARDRAAEILDSIDPTIDRAGVIFATASPTEALPRLTSNVEALMDTLRASEVTLERADLGSALAMAAEFSGATSDGDARRRRVLVISDLQRTQWMDFAAPPELDLELHPVGPEVATNNLAIHAIEVAPAAPIVGQPALVSFTVSNFGSAARRPIVVVEGAGFRHEVSPSLKSDDQVMVTIEATFSEAGSALLSATLIDDSFIVDDVARLVVPVRHARRIGILTRADPENRQSFLYYLISALAPNRAAAIEPVVLEPSGQSAESLAIFDGVMLCEAGAPDAQTLRALASFMADGGGVLWFFDSEQAQLAATMLSEAAGEAFALPVRPVDGFKRYPAEAALHIGGAEFGAQPLRALDGPAGRSLRQIPFLSIAPAAVASHGVELLTFDSDEPLLVWGHVGQGRLATFHASLAPADSAMIKSPVFPALIHELVRFTGSTERLSAPTYVGLPRTVVQLVDANQPPAEPVIDGRGDSVRVSIRPGSPFITLTAPPLERPGFFEFVDADGRITARGAVSMDPLESDMRVLSSDAAERQLDSVASIQFQNRSTIPERKRTELWPMLLAACLVMLAAEPLVATRLARTRRARERES